LLLLLGVCPSCIATLRTDSSQPPLKYSN